MQSNASFRYQFELVLSDFLKMCFVSKLMISEGNLKALKLIATDRSSLTQLTLYQSTKSVNGEVLLSIERIVSLIVM